MNFPIHPKGFWETDDASGHHYDPALSQALISYLEKNSVNAIYDFGCGMGDYAKAFIESGIETKAFDGNPNTKELSGGIADTLDLSEPFHLSQKFKAVLSLEVGEHIPASYESIYIENLIRHSKKYLILSWAIPGQIGDGHVNCKSNEYIIQQFESRGFQYLKEDSDYLREKSTAEWFVNTIMVFKKRSRLNPLNLLKLSKSHEQRIINTKRTC